MYQETNGGNATKKQDLLLFFGLLALVILAKMLMNAVSSIPHGQHFADTPFHRAYTRMPCDIQKAALLLSLYPVQYGARGRRP